MCMPRMRGNDAHNQHFPCNGCAESARRWHWCMTFGSVQHVKHQPTSPFVPLVSYLSVLGRRPKPGGVYRIHTHDRWPVLTPHEPMH